MLKSFKIFLCLLVFTLTTSCYQKTDSAELAVKNDSVKRNYVICQGPAGKETKKLDTEYINKTNAKIEKVDPEKAKMMEAANNQDHIVAIRNAINEFLTKPENPKNYKESAISGDSSSKKSGFIYLEKNGFLRSKFVPINVEEGPGNSYICEIIFFDKQDKLFEVNVVFEKKSFVVKSIKESSRYDEQELRSLRILYATYLNEKSYGI